jgi:hypothetical protein
MHTMIELYHNDMSVCAQKARFALAEKKLQWEGHHLNLRAGRRHWSRAHTSLKVKAIVASN